MTNDVSLTPQGITVAENIERLERHMILRNQETIMKALLVLVGTQHKASADLFYDIAKTYAYLGERK